MAGIESQLHEINRISDLQLRDQRVNRLHPLVKLLFTIAYMIVVVSCGKYNLSFMILLGIYPVVLFALADLSMKEGLYRMRHILPLVMAVGIFNPFLDRTPIGQIAGITIGAGVYSMLTLMMKGIYSVLSAYVLIATTTIEDICRALRLIHVPKTIVMVILLIYRYIFILGQEAERIMNAYRLRAPSQKGIHYKAWGPLVGQWLIRSMDRAQAVYESMQLRGFEP